MIGIYVRVSTTQQRDNYSTDVQRARGIAFAERIKEPYKLYDEAASAKSISGRVEFKRMIADVKKDIVHKVWVIEFSRLTRDIEDALQIRKVFIAASTEVFVNDERMDLSSPEAVLMYHIKSSVSEYERSNTIARIRRARREQIDGGNNSFGRIFGYDYEHDKKGSKVWKINKREAYVVRMIFTMYLDSIPFGVIAKKLTDAGFKSKSGSTFSRGALEFIVKHPEYFGLTHNTKDELIPSMVYPAIITDMSYDEFLEKSSNRHVEISNFQEAKGILSGIAACSECGTRFYVFRYNRNKPITDSSVTYRHRERRPSQMKCSNRPMSVNKKQLEEYVYSCYTDMLNNKDEVCKMIRIKQEDVLFDVEAFDAQFQDHVVLLASLAEKRQRIIEGVSEGLFSMADAKSHLKSLEEKEAAAETTMTSLEKQRDLKKMDAANAVDDFAKQCLLEFDASSIQKKREIYMSVISHLLIDHGTIKLRFISGASYGCQIKDLAKMTMSA
jgi:site-specific DNA recombinase